ncbi:MAG: serine/threonine protein kinase, partial [Nanoarchaeota archaeon]|nr:serine/threonine protein kinase [Nanoarchaeota archaeon]
MNIETDAFEEEFEFIKQLGKGSYGTVYLVRNRELGRQEDMKILHRRLSSQSRDFFKQEAEMMTALSEPRHPNIPMVYSLLEKDGILAFTSEHIGGESLADKIKRTYSKGDALRTSEILDIVVQLADTLQHAHEKGIVHRDVKPGNIILGEDGIPRLIDCGIAQLSHRLGATASLGTIPYMPLEQLVGGGDSRVDVYALGALMYELFTGLTPWCQKGEDDEAIIENKHSDAFVIAYESEIDAGLESIIRNATMRKPEQRYGSAHELGSAIRKYQTAITRRKFLGISSAAIGVGALFIAGWNYADYRGSIKYIQEEIRNTNPEDTGAMNELMVELSCKIADQEILPLYRDRMAFDLFPFATTQDHIWYPTGPNKRTSGYSIRILKTCFNLSGNPEFLELAKKKADLIMCDPPNEVGLNAIRFFHAGKDIGSAASYYANKIDEQAGIVNVGSIFENKFSEVKPRERIIHIQSLGAILPLLAAASQIEGLPSAEQYARIVRQHTDNMIRFGIRKDYSTRDLVKFDLDTGEFQEGNKWAVHPAGCWSRGHAIAIKWFLDYHDMTQDQKYLALARKMTDFYLRKKPLDHICYYDQYYNEASERLEIPGFKPQTLAMVKDTYPAVIMASNLLRMARLNPDYEPAAYRIMHSIATTCVDANSNDDLIVTSSCDNLRSDSYTNCCIIWTVDSFLDIGKRIKEKNNNNNI